MASRSEAPARITGSMLRDLVACERRPWHDVHTDPTERDPVSSFVQFLWADGVAHEDAIVAALPGRIVDLRRETEERIDDATAAALAGDHDHVVGAKLASGRLTGRPDLISRVDGRWVAGDIKSGSPFKPNGRDPREEYAVQVGLYARLLAENGHGPGDRAFVIGADGALAWYELDQPWAGTTIRARTEERVEQAATVLAGTAATRGEHSAKCGLCHWRSVCRRELHAADDLTLVAGLGRSLRGSIERVARTRGELARLDLSSVAKSGGRTTLQGVGAARLKRLQARAQLQLAERPQPYALAPLGLARAPVELHWDIEADPTSGTFVYLHGVWERRLEDGAGGGRFHHFLAEREEAEREAFASCWRFLNADPHAVVYYYSPYEKTAYRLLQNRHPDVCSREELEAFFASARVIDLYTEKVAPLTEWPTSSYGIKALAKLAGFRWNAADASGAASIAWFQEWRRTGESALRERIIDYNRSDCQASATVLDALLALPVRTERTSA